MNLKEVTDKVLTELIVMWNRMDTPNLRQIFKD